jgi:proteasome assembly chaperone (PAC2) family protein
MGSLIIHERPSLEAPSMIIGFSGWMDGGDVSTGTIEYLKNKLKANKFAEIDPGEFYIFNLPGGMEQVAQFRPYTKIKDGLLIDFEYPRNEFFADQKSRVILFSGKEPNLRWDEYANCIFQLAEEFDVRKIYFVGSFAGATPHTREPRITCSVFGEEQKVSLKEQDVRFTNYEGPASIATLLNKFSKEKGIEMANLVAEIPAYIQVRNPRGIEAVIKRLVRILDLDIDLNDLHRTSLEFEKNIDKALVKQPILTEQVKKLEDNYDSEIFGTDQDFENWLKQQGIDKL